MVVEIFSICDAATDYGGRLNLLGAFEGIAAPDAPVTRDHVVLAVRLRFDASEAGRRTISIRFLDPEERPLLPDLKARIAVKALAGRRSCAHNLVLNINRLVFPMFGEYWIRLFVDDRPAASLPLLVAQSKASKPARNSMDN